MAKKYFEDPDVEEVELPENVQKAPLPICIFGKIIKYTFIAVILAINALLIWRMFSTGLPSDMKTIFADTELLEAYYAYEADTSEDKGPFAIFQEYCLNRPLTIDEEDEETGQKDNYGYFGFVDQAIFPTANQVQVIFRYNLSTLEHLKEDYSLEFTPDKKGDYYDVTVRVIVYNDKNNKSGGTHEERLTCATVDADEKNVYCYRQLVAHDLPELDSIKEIYMDVYYTNDEDYEALPYGSVRIYSDELDTSEYKLDKKDIKALKGED